MSPGSMMCTLRSICRAISSMCLSWIVTPWLAVHLLDLVHQVLLQREHALDPQLLVRVHRTLGELLAHLDRVAVAHGQARPERDRVLHLVAVVVGDADPADVLLVVVLDRDRAGELGDLRLALGLAGLEQLDDTRQTVRDVLAGDAAGVERPHRELRAGLADRLGGDDADRLADVDHPAARERPPVADRAHADLGLAGRDRAALHALDAGVDDRGRDLVVELVAPGRDLLAADLHVLGQHAAEQRRVDVRAA